MRAVGSWPDVYGQQCHHFPHEDYDVGHSTVTYLDVMYRHACLSRAQGQTVGCLVTIQVLDAKYVAERALVQGCSYGLGSDIHA